MFSLPQIIFLSICFTVSNEYKILIYSPQIGYSHLQYWGSIADILTEAGHDVTVLINGYYDEVNATGVRLSKTIVRPRDYNLPYNYTWFLSDVFKKSGSSITQMIKALQYLHWSQVLQCTSLFADKKLLRSLKAEKFDLGMTEIYSTCGFAFFHEIGIQAYVTGFATTMVEFATIPFGIDNNPSFVAAALSSFGDEMTFMERMQNLLTMVMLRSLSLFYLPCEQYYADLIPGYDLRTQVGKSAFVFVNEDEFLTFPRPITNKIIYVGGVAVPDPKPLTADYLEIINESDGPVVYISFGTMAYGSKAVTYILDAFVELFKNMPEVTFIWKYEADDEVAKDLRNVFKRKWVRQNDLLNHPSVTTFISHCGQNSVLESIYASVPIICLPLFAEQAKIAKTIEKRKVGLVVEKRHLTGHILTEATRSVLYNKSFKIETKKLREMFRKKPVTPKERVLKYTEFAAEFQGTENLQPSSVRLNFFQYYLIDVIVSLIIICLLFISAFVLIILQVMRRLFRRIKFKKS